jgi:hypothetical protein
MLPVLGELWSMNAWQDDVLTSCSWLLCRSLSLDAEVTVTTAFLALETYLVSIIVCLLAWDASDPSPRTGVA